jgi:hypothetical protein
MTMDAYDMLSSIGDLVPLNYLCYSIGHVKHYGAADGNAVQMLSRLSPVLPLPIGPLLNSSRDSLLDIFCSSMPMPSTGTNSHRPSPQRDSPFPTLLLPDARWRNDLGGFHIYSLPIV